MKTRPRWWLFILLFVLLNGWILRNRNAGFRYFPYKTYPELYVSDSMLRITGLHFSDHALHLDFSQPLPVTKWHVYVDGNSADTAIAAHNTLALPLKTFSHTYNLVPENTGQVAPIRIIVDHTPRTQGFDNEYIYSSLPGPDSDVGKLNTWKTDPASFDPAEVAKAKELLAGAMNVTHADDDLTKTLKIGKFLRHLRYSANGADINTMGLSPFAQVEFSAKNDVNLICGNYTAMFHFLASVAGITTRAITFTGPSGNWHYGIHYYNEVYLREQQQWSLVDNANNVFLPHDSTRFYNAVDVNKMAKVNGFGGKFSYDLNSDTSRLQPYGEINYFHRYYNASNATLSFIRRGVEHKSVYRSLWEFYFPAEDFFYFSDTKSNNFFLLAIKYVVFVSLILILAAYLVWEFKFTGYSTNRKK